MEKIYELENAFLSAFNDAIRTIYIAAEEGKPFTLKQVLEFGFNNVQLYDEDGFTTGYEESDFTEKQLNTKVKLNECEIWDEDADGYRFLKVEAIEIED